MPQLTTMANLLFSLDAVYAAVGLFLWIFAAQNFRDRSNEHRLGSALFWSTLGTIFAFGGRMPHWVTGLLVLFMVAIDGAGRVGHKAAAGGATTSGQAIEKARALGDKIFL